MSKQPHIVIFNPDQWRGDSLGHLGHPAVQTPVLDEMVEKEAVSFRYAFCQNPVCTPSRCSFMTGWYPHVRGHRTMHHMLHHEHDEQMLLRILKEHGYHTFWGGKNDVIPGDEAGQGNDPRVRYADTISDYSNYELQPNWHGPVYQQARGEHGSDTFYSFFIGKMDKHENEHFYHDDDWLHVQEAIKLIKNRPADKPLALYLPLVYPHPPYGVEEPYFSAIDRDAIEERLRAENWELKPSIIQEIRKRQNMQSWTEDRWTELRATYYGMCMRIDALLGDLIQAMRDEGIWDDTAFFLFSDHGDFTGDYGLVEKTQNTFEDCLSRVPFIIKPPKDTPCKPGVRDCLTELVDFSETVYDLTGINPGYDRFGKSLLPVIAGDTDEHRDAAFCEGGRLMGEIQAAEREYLARNPDNPEQGAYWPRASLQWSDEHPWHTKATMCRTKDYKYVKRLYESDELYDLKKDPGECLNVINDPAYAEIKVQMIERLLRWYQETCDVVPQNTDPR